MDDRKTFSGKRVSEGLSSNFKSSSREKKATWGNRFIRDHHDLLYDADPNSISNRLKQSAKTRREDTKNTTESPIASKF